MSYLNYSDYYQYYCNNSICDSAILNYLRAFNWYNEAYYFND